MKVFKDFIAGEFISHNVCDSLIEYHAKSIRQKPGMVYNDTDQNLVVNKEVKDSIDVEFLNTTYHYKNYTQELSYVIQNYIDIFNFCNKSAPWGLLENPTIQKYRPNGGFFKWHCERSSGCQPSASRHLVFMTFLNTVLEDGETEFYYQKIKIKPEKGLTLLWPADWTYTHRGIPSIEEKFIITGWLSFLDNQPVAPINLN